MLKKNILQTNKKGFALVEALVAILILSAMIGTVFQVIASSGITVNGVRDELVAYKLANEGVEILHNRKDSTYDTWKASGFPTNFPGWGLGSPLTPLPDLASTIYSKYTRSYQVLDQLSVTGVLVSKKVSVTVLWTNHGVSKSVVVYSILFL